MAAVEDSISRFIGTFDLHNDAKSASIGTENVDPFLSRSSHQDRFKLTGPFEKLVIKPTEVYWFKGGLLARKLTYNSRVVDAFFTCFEDDRLTATVSSLEGSNLTGRNTKIMDYKKRISSTHAQHSIDSRNGDKYKPISKRSLVVVLEEQIYVYEESGSSNVISFSFKIKCAFPFTNGVIIGKEPETTPFFERLLNIASSNNTGNVSSGPTPAYQRQTSINHLHNSQRQLSMNSTTSNTGLSSSNKMSLLSSNHSSDNNFLTLLQPLQELGSVVSSSTSSFSSREELVCFPSSELCTIAATYNPIETNITLYHTRYLSKNNKGSTQNPGSRSLSNFNRRPSKKAGWSSINPTNTPKSSEIAEELDGNTEQDQKRSISTMSFDRMASGGLGNEYNNTNLPSGITSEITRLRKDIILTELNVIEFNDKMKHLKCFNLSCRSQEQEAVVVCNRKKQEVGFYIYHSSSSAIGLPSYKNFYSIGALDSVPLHFSNLKHNGYVALLTDNYCITLINPFLGLSSAVIDLSNRFPPVLSLDDSKEEEISIYCSNGKHYTLNLLITPQNEAVSKLIDSLKYLSNVHIYDYFWLQWCSNMSLNLVESDEWSCFIITLLSLVIPEVSNGTSSETSEIYDTNEVTKLLKIAEIITKHNKINSSHYSLEELLPTIILSFHVVREDLKLNIFAKEDFKKISLLLAQLSSWACWSEAWIKYYMIDPAFLDKSKAFFIPQQIMNPPNLFASLSSLFTNKIVPYLSFSQVVEEHEKVDKLITPRSFYVLRLFEMLISQNYTHSDVVSLMVEYGITESALETYPPGIFFPLKNSVVYCRENLPAQYISESYIPLLELINRKDILEFLSLSVASAREIDYNNLLLEPSKEIDEVLSAVRDSEMISAWDFQEEADKFHVTKLIFSKDRRFFELSNLLQSSVAHKVAYLGGKKAKIFDGSDEDEEKLEFRLHFNNETDELDDESKDDFNDDDDDDDDDDDNNDTGDADYDAKVVNQRRLLGIKNALRVLTIPVGRGAVFISSRKPLMTERFPIPRMNLDTLIVPEMINVMLSSDSVDQETLDWGYFHNGCASGLMISKETKDISGSWITFNRPHTLNSQHAGFLLGLGLNGHLKNLEEWHIYNYLGPKHVFASVALLLGMAASLRGTMNVKLTKVLSVHVVALLPNGSNDLNVSLPVQTAGLIGIGLLYLESQHRRMTEVLLTQISSNLYSNDKEYVNEGYRLAAGISLGYINLGKGELMKNRNDTHVIDQLILIATSMKDIQTSQEQDKSCSGALMALLFMFLKSNNKEISKKLSVPTTLQTLDYLRPDCLLLRCLTKNLIMWDSIFNTKEWVESQIPFFLKKLFQIENINHLDSDYVLYLNIIAGVCLSIGVRYASTNDLTAKETLLYYVDKLMFICSLKANSYDEKSALIEAQSCRDIVLISISLVLAGSGDLDVLTRLRFLQDEFKTTVGYGNYMAINTSLGFLFLGRGQQSFNTSDNFSIAALVTSIYPVYNVQYNHEGKRNPNNPNNPTGSTKSYNDYSEILLQALRHFWALSVEPRCLITRDVETKKPIQTDTVITLKSGEKIALQTPCLLPNLKSISKIETVNNDSFYKIELDFVNNKHLLKIFKESLTLFMYKRKNYETLRIPLLESLNDNKAGGASNNYLNSNDYDDEVANDFSGYNVSLANNSGNNNKSIVINEVNEFLKPLEDLHVIGKNLNDFEKRMFLKDELITIKKNKNISEVIDFKLEIINKVKFIVGKSNISIDDLWNLKLIFNFADNLDSTESSDLSYLNARFIGDLKNELWKSRNC